VDNFENVDEGTTLKFELPSNFLVIRMFVLRIIVLKTGFT